MNGASLNQSLGTGASDGPIYPLMIDEYGTWQNDDWQEKYNVLKAKLTPVTLWSPQIP
jgi:hypothetical protein